MDIARTFPIPGLCLHQSDTWNFIVNLPEYLPNYFTLTYVIKPALSGASLSFSSIPWPDNTNYHQILVANTLTATYPAGPYSAQCFAVETATGYRTTLGQTELRVLADLALISATADTRSKNEITLDAINTALAADLTNTIVEYSVGGRTFKKNRTELLKLRHIYEFAVRKEKHLPEGNIIRYSF